MRSKKKWLSAFLALAVLVTGSMVGSTPALAREGLAEKRVVVLDPGHGGEEDGAYAVHNGQVYREEEINWKISQYTMEALKKYPNIEVRLTKTKNQTMGLSARVMAAKKYNADLLVSQHINDGGSPWPNGSSVLISRGTYRSYLAEKEKMFGNYVLGELGKLGLARRFPETGGMEYRMSENGSTYPNGAPRDYYGIVALSVEQDIPGVIIEHAFITNESDASRFLSSDEQIKKLGQADARAIALYFRRIAKDSGKDNVVPSNENNGWKLVNNNYYYYINGERQRNRVLNLEDGTYYVTRGGKRYYGWKTVNGVRYYFDKTKEGRARVGWLRQGKDYYYFNAGGIMYKNARLISTSGKIYIFGEDGKRCSGWTEYQGQKYYILPDGYAHTGWLKYNNKWYYFHKKTAAMYKNRTATTSSGKKYRFDENGICINRQ